MISGKREKRIHLVRSVYDLERGSVRLVWGGETCTFSFEDREAMGEFFSWVLGYRVEVRECLEGGFPDDRKAHGPTVVSEATLREVASWFGLGEDNTRRRFRANLEFLGVPPFWEDSLADNRKFYIGNVLFVGEDISKRCPVPTRDPYTGETLKGFVREFVKRRSKSHPWCPREMFSDTFYRVCINTSTLKGGELRVGDELRLYPD